MSLQEEILKKINKIYGKFMATQGLPVWGVVTKTAQGSFWVVLVDDDGKLVASSQPIEIILSNPGATAAEIWAYASRTLTSPVFGNLVTKNLADILADSVAFNGADVATILSGVATLAGRLTSTRAGYLDNLSGGAVALEATLTAMKGTSWSTETLKVIKDAITALNNITAADVWGYSTRTLSSPVFGDLVTKNLAHILSDSVAFKGTDIATILSEIQNATYGLGALKTFLEDEVYSTLVNTVVSDVETILDRVDDATYGLSALNTDLDTLLGRLTVTRAGYLDNLSGGVVALASVCLEARLAELDATNIPADIDTLLARLTATRAGYLDLLDTKIVKITRPCYS